MKGDVFKPLAEVIKKMWSEFSSVRVLDKVSLKNKIPRCTLRFMRYVQQDAQTFLGEFLELLYKDINRDSGE